MVDLIPRGCRRRDWGALADQEVTLSVTGCVVTTAGSAPVDLRQKLHRFAKDGRYVDLYLGLDDGKKIPCHRCVLAAASNYFDCMLSSGMRETHQDVVSIRGVSSSILETALQFVYTARCTFKYADYFDMIIVANMFELKELERALIEHIVVMEQNTTLFSWERSHDFKTKDEHNLEFLIEALMFCHRFPVIAESLDTNLLNKKRLGSVSLADSIYNSLQSPKWVPALERCSNLMEADIEFFCSVLVESGIAEANANAALRLISNWLTHEKEPQRLDHLKTLLNSIDLKCMKDSWVEDLWQGTALEKHLEVFYLTRDVTQRQLLVMPFEGEERFLVCHDMQKGISYRLDYPDVEGVDVVGTPQLMTTWRPSSDYHHLFCHHIVPRNFEGEFRLHLSFCRHRYSLSSRLWLADPKDLEMTNPWSLRPQEKIPLKTEGLLTPTVVKDKALYPFIRLSHDFQIIPEEKSESAEAANGKNELPAFSILPTKNTQYSDKPGRRMAEVLAVKHNGEGFIDLNLWQSLIPNLEVLGVGVYDRNFSYRAPSTIPRIGVAVFGNSYSSVGTKKEPVTMLNALRTKDPFPGGVCDKPFSVVSHDEYIFVVPTAPYITTSNKGNPTLRLPRVYAFSPRAVENSWTTLPTPTFPDIDYASLYLDPVEQWIVLVLVQAPTSSALFSALTAETGRFEPSNRGRGRGRGKRKPVKRPPALLKTADGRVVGLFRLNLTPTEIIEARMRKKNPLKDKGTKPKQEVWKPLLHSNSTADFFALGCRLPGEVRILSARINTAHLQAIDLSRFVDDGAATGSSSSSAVVEPDQFKLDEKENPSGARPKETRKSFRGRSIKWVRHEVSPFSNLSVEALETRLNSVYRGNAALNSLLTKRSTPAPLLETDDTQRCFPAITFERADAYSTDSDDYSDDDFSVYRYSGYNPYDDDDSYDDFGYGPYDGYNSDDFYSDYGGDWH